MGNVVLPERKKIELSALRELYIAAISQNVGNQLTLSKISRALLTAQGKDYNKLLKKQQQTESAIKENELFVASVEKVFTANTVPNPDNKVKVGDPKE